SVRGVEDLHERQTQVALGDQIDAATRVFSGVFRRRPLRWFVKQIDQSLIDWNHDARPALLVVERARYGQDCITHLLGLQTLPIESPEQYVFWVFGCR